MFSGEVPQGAHQGCRQGRKLGGNSQGVDREVKDYRAGGGCVLQEVPEVPGEEVSQEEPHQGLPSSGVYEQEHLRAQVLQHPGQRQRGERRLGGAFSIKITKHQRHNMIVENMIIDDTMTLYTAPKFPLRLASDVLRFLR